MKPDEFFNDDVSIDPPEKWEGGNVEHTGGGIYCRTWRRDTPNGGRIEVIYNSFQEGVGLNYDPEGDGYVSDSISGLSYDDPHMDRDTYSDEAYAQAAARLMHAVNIAITASE